MAELNPSDTIDGVVVVVVRIKGGLVLVLNRIRPRQALNTI